MKSLKIISGLTVLILGLMLVGGCGKKSLTEKILEKGLEKATNGQVDVDLNGGVQFKTNEGEWSVGENATVPSDYPKSELPLYSGATVISAIKTASPLGWGLTLKSNDSVDKVYSYYEKTIKDKGWTIDSSMDFSGVKILSISKSGYEGSVTVMVGDEDKGAGVQINLSTKTTATETE